MARGDRSHTDRAFVRQAGRRMKQGGGTIINVASVYGLVGHDSTLYDPAPGWRAPPEALTYLVAKAGVINMTRGLAVYWAKHNIRVNAIAPGMVRTERLGRQMSDATWDRLAARIPLGRPADPDERPAPSSSSSRPTRRATSPANPHHRRRLDERLVHNPKLWSL
ncbi:MAG: SDR family oxidoreductase [Thermomicrobiales bacterium]